MSASAQGGQTVRVTGTTGCMSADPAVFDLTLLVLDRALIGWQRASMSTMMGMGLPISMGCVQSEQFALVRSD